MPRFCVGLGTFFTAAAVVLLIFAHISSLSTQLVPRHLYVVSVDTTGFDKALRAIPASLPIGRDVYAPQQNISLGGHQGLRDVYQWGLWGACAGQAIGGGAEACNKTHIAYAFDPVAAILADLPTAYADPATEILGGTSTFQDTRYLRLFSQIAFYFIFVAAILAGVTLLIGWVAHRFAFLTAAFFAFFAAVACAVGAIIWTVIVTKVRSAVNGLTPNGVDIGIDVEYGNALWVVWGAFAALILSVIPFIFACCVGRRDKY